MKKIYLTRFYILGFRNQSCKSGVKGGVLIAALRSLSSNHGIEMANLANKFLQRKSTGCYITD